MKGVAKQYFPFTSLEWIKRARSVTRHLLLRSVLDYFVSVVCLMTRSRPEIDELCEIYCLAMKFLCLPRKIKLPESAFVVHQSASTVLIFVAFPTYFKVPFN